MIYELRYNKYKDIKIGDDMNIQTNTLIVNNYQTTVSNELKNSLETCNKFYFNIAFINFDGLQLFLHLFEELNNKGIKGKIITSTYLNFTDPKALKKLNSFDNIELKVYNDIKNKGFHSKAYIFEYDDYYKIIIGSSNLTVSAMKRNIEWNVRVISKKDDIFTNSVMEEFINIWDQLDEVTEDFLQQYDQFIKEIKEKKKKIGNTFFKYNDAIVPNKMQERAMFNLNRLRECGEHKALIVAATGTGKTYLSAFDVKQFHPKKMLFIVHREEILLKSEESFKKVLGAKLDTGFFTGRSKEMNAKYLFTTIQTLSRYYDMFDPNEFDYIILDEAHHAAGDTYTKVLTYFEPKFLLGMTATPERCDKVNIYDLFDNNVAIEIRLHEVMDEELVVPFHYFGITDIDEVDFSGISLNNTAAVAKALKVNQRVNFIIKQMNLYEYDGEYRKCLGFCVNIEHAKFMCEEFNKRGIVSAYLTGEDQANKRTEYVKRLEDDGDPLEVIFTVDIFNEGIDIPSINLVLMLRPTNSPIIFIQQLGRGLRKYEDKKYLTVLDFIGNHNRAFLIAIALKGSRYYDKDSLKVSVKNDFIDIPGDTFIQLDPISKERILNQIDFENFNSMKYLKEEYNSFKALLQGKIPYYLMDYIKYEGSPDPVKFFNKEKTYLEFLTKVEKDERCLQMIIDEEYLKYLRYISSMLPLKRPYEFQILLDLLYKDSMDFNDCKQSILKCIKTIDDDSVFHAMEVLNFNYYDSSQKNRWNKMAELRDGILYLSNTFKYYLQDEDKKKYIIDTLRYGLIRYKEEFNEVNYGKPFFKLYAQYAMQDVALVANYRKIHSSFRGSGLIPFHKEYFLFVDLLKDSNIKESINYKDKFISRKLFQWQSPNSTSQDSERGKNIIKNKERNIHLHLFVRKLKEIDGKIEPYIYIGKMNTIQYEGNKPITIVAELEHEVDSKIYGELVEKNDMA